MLLLISALSGHLSSDPRVVTIMSEGDAAHIGIAVLISCVCAPLVEEVLFRGLLLESLRTRGEAFGIWMSGLAFAVWHLTPAALSLNGPSGAWFGALTVTTPAPPSLATVADRMTRGGFASLSQEQFTVDASTVRNIDLPVGAAVELDVTVQGHGGHMVFVPR